MKNFFIIIGIIFIILIIIYLFFKNKKKKKKYLYEIKNTSDYKTYNNLMDNKLYIGDSNINGKGLFTNSNIVNGQYITQVADLTKINEGKEFRTEFCKYVNHQQNGNTKVEQIGDKMYLVSNRDIKGGEELTTNYKVLPDVFDRSTNGYIELK